MKVYTSASLGSRDLLHILRHLVPHLHSSRVVQAPFNILNYLIMEQLTATFLGRTM